MGFQPTTNYFVKNTQLDTALVLSKEFLEIQATIGCRFILKRVRDIIKTYSEINPSNKNVKQRLLPCML